MFRRIIIESMKEEPKQRRALFRVECKILDKVCKVIIDSGSTNNIVSEETVNNLGLAKIPHTHPYRITQLNKGKNVLVNERDQVEFTIGGYKDKIICDILPMDACHFLLCRPWQYDRKAIHNGEKNSYSFKKSGVTYYIQSLVYETQSKAVTPNLLLIRGKYSLHDLKNEEGICFTIMVKPKEEDKPK